MKRMLSLLSLLLASLFMLSALSAVSVFADDEVTGQTAQPDWVITEISNDTQGKEGNTNGYTAEVTADTFEFIEIYNNSGRELNLYDYALTYNGNARDSSKFEHQITEYTPIKPGDYLDGSTLVPTEATLPFGDLSNRPVNPDTCTVAPGEVVVLWMVYLEAYQARFNGGKGVSMADFRAHWSIPEDVKVIAVDANGNTKNGGHSKNFNVKNSAVGTYGIALQSEELNAAANTKDGNGVDGNYWESEQLVFWATVDFDNVLLDGSMYNLTYSFTWDFGGYAAQDIAYTYIMGEEYVYDARRGFVLTIYDEPTVGQLNPLQKMTLGVELSEGESFAFYDDNVYVPFLDENIEGYKVNGKLYKGGDTFTAPAAGTYTFDYFFEGDEEKTITVTLAIDGYPFEQPAAVNVVTGTCMEVPKIDLPDDGSRFDGWYTSADCREDSRFDFATPITEDMTLYAVLIPAETVPETTEAPTEAPTDEVTEAPTAEATEGSTAEDTEGSTAEDTAAATDEPKGGCGATVTLAVLPCLAAFAWMARKKRED